MTTEGVTGQPLARPHGWFEELIFISPMGPGNGDADWTGSFDARGDFDLSIPGFFPADTYALFALKHDGIPAFSFSEPFDLPAGPDDVRRNFLTTAQYSVMFDKRYPEWGGEPWTWGWNFYQTFVATHARVTRIATLLVDFNEAMANLAMQLYRVGEGPPSSWTPIAERRLQDVSWMDNPLNFILWEAFPSDAMTLEVGETYALRVWTTDGREEQHAFGIVTHFNSVGHPYEGGMMYSDDAALPDRDMYGYVSGGAPRTLVNHTPIHDFQNVALVGFGERRGQTFVASGNGLAGVQVVLAPDDAPPQSFQLYDGFGGSPIGPAKTCFTAPGPFQCRAAAYWFPGEAPLTPGREYYIEIRGEGNYWFMMEDLPGQAYVAGVPQGGRDLMLCVAEYDEPEPLLMLR